MGLIACGYGNWEKDEGEANRKNEDIKDVTQSGEMIRTSLMEMVTEYDVEKAEKPTMLWNIKKKPREEQISGEWGSYKTACVLEGIE